jgi:hypothetical protein
VHQAQRRGVIGLALALRLALELAGVAAVAWWGIQRGSDEANRAILAIGAATLLIVVWGLVVAPKARNPLAPRPRWLIGSALLLLSAVALWSAGSPTLALVFGCLVIMDSVVLLVLDAPPQVGPGRGGGRP